jgi:hypothetical protein
MTPDVTGMSADLTCDLCGYDLRAQPPDGQCPECGASVAESRRLAATPRRPDWRDSDPRWRRRLLAGAWLLVLLPLLDVLKVSGWASTIPVPTPFTSHGAVRTLDDTLLCYPGVYQPLAFCVGLVLLFSKERNRRRARLDWTRRWGVLCCYVVFLLCAAGVLFIAALVSVGIGALFLSMPLENQPRFTVSWAHWSWAAVRYGPQPFDAAGVVLVAVSSIAIFLACIPLFDALRSSGPKRLAAVLLTPLALFALVYLAQVARYCLGITYLNPRDLFQYGVYFRPELLVTSIAAFPFGAMLQVALPYPAGVTLTRPEPGALAVEAVKWCTVLAIAVWLTTAQLAAWHRRRTTSPGSSLPPS